jgi:vacuolar-type H+-ATPase subunit F/Vma7
MSEVAAIGTQTQIGGFSLAGARVYPADTVEAVKAAWQGLPQTVAVVILTAPAAAALTDELAAHHAPLSVVMTR